MKSFGMFISLNRLALASIVFALFVGALVLDSGQTLAKSLGFGGRTMNVVSTTGQAGSPVTVSIDLDSQGDEVSGSFSLNFDPAIFSNPVVALGSGSPAGASVSINPTQVAQGRLGVLVDATGPFAISPPNRQVVAVTFDIAPSAPAGATPITFVTSPTAFSVSNLFGALLATTYQVGSVTISVPTSSFVTIGGRVTTPSGQNLRNAIVALIDSNSVRRTAVTSTFGLYSFTNVETGRLYTISASSRRFRFAPRVTTITESVSNLDFVGLE